MKKVFLAVMLVLMLFASWNVCMAEACDEEKVTVCMRVTGRSVFVRSEPDIESGPLDVIYKGDLIEVTTWYSSEDGRIWAEMLGSQGIPYGFVSMRYLESASKDFQNMEIKNKMHTIKDYVEVHAKTSLESEIVEYLEKDKTIIMDFAYPTSAGRIWVGSRDEFGKWLGYISLGDLAC